MAPATVTITTPDGEDYDFAVTRSPFVVGRQSGCDLQLPARAVSSRHAELEVRADGTVWVTDLGSKNGTLLDGVPLPPHQAVPLEPESEIEIAPVTLRVRPGLPVDVSQSLSLEQSYSLSRSLLSGIVGAGAARSGRACLTVVEGPGKGRRLALGVRQERFEIGRGAEADLDVGAWELASAPATVELRGRSYHLLPHRTLRLRVGREVVRQPRPLRHGDLLRVGRSRIRFEDPLQSELDALEELERGEGSSTGVGESGGGSGSAAAHAGGPLESRPDGLSAPRWSPFERWLFVFALVALVVALIFLVLVFS